MVERLVCIREPEHFADFQRFESTQRFAERIGAALEAVPLSALPGLGADWWADVGLAWAPFRNTDSPAVHIERCRAMRALPEGLPLVLDVDNPDSLLPAVHEHLAGRRLGCRMVRELPPDPAFAVSAPYANYPTELPGTPARDVIMLDVHKWEPMASHLGTLLLMERLGRGYKNACAAAGLRLRFFLTSFTPIEPYMDAMQALLSRRFGIHESLGALEVKDNLLPPAETRQDFLAMLARTRLFVTFHNNITDMLLTEALANDIPSLILHPLEFLRPRRNLDAWGMSDLPGYAEWSQAVIRAQPDMGDSNFLWLKCERTGAGGRGMLGRAFHDGWERLWAWASSGR